MREKERTQTNHSVFIISRDCQGTEQMRAATASTEPPRTEPGTVPG